MKYIVLKHKLIVGKTCIDKKRLTAQVVLIANGQYDTGAKQCVKMIKVNAIYHSWPRKTKPFVLLCPRLN